MRSHHQEEQGRIHPDSVLQLLNDPLHFPSLVQSRLTEPVVKGHTEFFQLLPHLLQNQITRSRANELKGLSSGVLQAFPLERFQPPVSRLLTHPLSYAPDVVTLVAIFGHIHVPPKSCAYRAATERAN